jgi:hypothetical protein
MGTRRRSWLCGVCDRLESLESDERFAKPMDRDCILDPMVWNFSQVLSDDRFPGVVLNALFWLFTTAVHSASLGIRHLSDYDRRTLFSNIVW